jgi:GNAT superfamily N-acetyltransferase
MSTLSVGRAQEAEAAACLALLPEARQLPAELLIARRDGALAGAAAVVWRSWAKPGGFPTLVHVLPQVRRRGVGRALMTAAQALTRSEAEGLWSLESVELDGPAAGFLTACGFEPARRQAFFQARTAAMRERLGPLLERLRSRGRIPADARVVPLREAPLEEVGWLVSKEFGGGPFSALNRLAARNRNTGISTEDKSQVLLHDGRVGAVVLARMDYGVGVVDARVVAPGLRGDWASALVLEQVLTRAEAESVAEFRFHCDETVLDTLHVARRAGARQTATKALFYWAASA